MYTSKKQWVDEVSDKYEELRLKNALKNEIINISQATEDGSSEEIRYKSWEKTVQDIFRMELNKSLTFSASLDDKEENYGDLIASFENLNWCLIEFKKDSGGIEEEKNKFVANRNRKYLDNNGILRKGKTSVGIQIEIEAFNWLNEKFGAVEKADFLEPHFIVFGLKNIDPKAQESQLQAIRYWDFLKKK
jgi:ribosomal protein S7